MKKRTLEDILYYNNWENESILRSYIIKTEEFKEKYPNIKEIVFSEEETKAMNWFVSNHWDKFYIINEELQLNDSIQNVLLSIETELMKNLFLKGRYKELGYLERENVFSILPIGELILLSKHLMQLDLEEDNRCKRMLRLLEELYQENEAKR